MTKVDLIPKGGSECSGGILQLWGRRGSPLKSRAPELERGSYITSDCKKQRGFCPPRGDKMQWTHRSLLKGKCTKFHSQPLLFWILVKGGQHRLESSGEILGCEDSGSEDTGWSLVFLC